MSVLGSIVAAVTGTPPSAAACRAALDDARDKHSALREHAVETDTAGAWRAEKDAAEELRRAEARLEVAERREALAAAKAEAQRRCALEAEYEEIMRANAPAALDAEASEAIGRVREIVMRTYPEALATLDEIEERAVARWERANAIASELGMTPTKNAPDVRWRLIRGLSNETRTALGVEAEKRGWRPWLVTLANELRRSIDG